MTPLHVPRDTPGFDPWRCRTPQPRDWKAWLKLLRRIADAWRDWQARKEKKP